MDGSSSPRLEISYSSNKDLSNHNSNKRCCSWEDQCIYETESDKTSETLYLNEQRNLEQKLWLSFQNAASAIAQLYKDRAQGSDDMWTTFQNAAEIATNLYRGTSGNVRFSQYLDGIDGQRSVAELAVQCGYNRRNKELLTWVKKKRRQIRREDLIGYLCGRSPPPRVSRPTTSLTRSPSLNRGSSSPDSRLQTFHEAVSMNGLNGAMADISFGGETSIRRTNSPARNCCQNFHPDLSNFLSDEIKLRNEALYGGASSRKRPSSVHEHKPSSPKRRK